MKKKTEVRNTKAFGKVWITRDGTEPAPPVREGEWEEIIKRYFPLETLADGYVQDHGDYATAKKQAQACLDNIIGSLRFALSRHTQTLVEEIRKYVENVLVIESRPYNGGHDISTQRLLNYLEALTQQKG